MSDNGRNRSDVEVFINPKSVAVIGASETMAAWGKIERPKGETEKLTKG